VRVRVRVWDTLLCFGYFRLLSVTTCNTLRLSSASPWSCVPLGQLQFVREQLAGRSPQVGRDCGLAHTPCFRTFSVAFGYFQSPTRSTLRSSSVSPWSCVPLGALDAGTAGRSPILPVFCLFRLFSVSFGYYLPPSTLRSSSVSPWSRCCLCGNSWPAAHPIPCPCLLAISVIFGYHHWPPTCNTLRSSSVQREQREPVE
jgi:hypothetical protein